MFGLQDSQISTQLTGRKHRSLNTSPSTAPFADNIVLSIPDTHCPMSSIFFLPTIYLFCPTVRCWSGYGRNDTRNQLYQEQSTTLKDACRGRNAGAKNQRYSPLSSEAIYSISLREQISISIFILLQTKVKWTCM